MKMDHDYKNAHVGNGARNMNGTERKKNGGAGYLASLFGFSMLCEYAHPATYGVRKPEVM